MKQGIVLRCALAIGAAAGVVAISACTPTSSGAPAPSRTQAQIGAPVATATSTIPQAPTSQPAPTAMPKVAVAVPDANTVSPPARIYYPTCGQPATKSKIEPSEIGFSCDSTLSLEAANWTTWNGSYAEGTGTLLTNNCTPDCANGTQQSNKVEIRFDKPVKLACGEFWSDAVVTYVGKPVGAPGNGKSLTLSPGDSSTFC
jgi:hypothetical protein